MWTLTGIWHGADINYLLWGIFLSIFIILEKYFFINFFKKINVLFSHLYFIVIMFFSFILFYNSKSYNFLNYLKSLFGKTEIVDLYTKNIILNNLFLIIISIIYLFPILDKIKIFIKQKLVDNEYLYFAIKILFIVFILFYSTILLIGNTSNPFLYFRF